jgi:hypothetical protein
LVHCGFESSVSKILAELIDCLEAVVEVVTWQVMMCDVMAKLSSLMATVACAEVIRAIN